MDVELQQLPITEKDVAPTFTEFVLPEVSQVVELHFPGGVRMVVSGSVDPVWLHQLILGHVYVGLLGELLLVYGFIK